ncbi:MAG: hypothetical protein EOO75_09900 [Myxococcales bacterium]|nr:MAG: hypothetical protein EOO75_09900 [Myxococcales bacterium]
MQAHRAQPLGRRGGRLRPRQRRGLAPRGRHREDRARRRRRRLERELGLPALAGHADGQPRRALLARPEHDRDSLLVEARQVDDGLVAVVPRGLLARWLLERDAPQTVEPGQGPRGGRRQQGLSPRGHRGRVEAPQELRTPEEVEAAGGAGQVKRAVRPDAHGHLGRPPLASEQPLFSCRRPRPRGRTRAGPPP